MRRVLVHEPSDQHIVQQIPNSLVPHRTNEWQCRVGTVAQYELGGRLRWGKHNGWSS